MDLERLDALLALLGKHDVSSFSYEDENVSLSLQLGQPTVAVAPPVVHAPAPVASAPTPTPAAGGPAPAVADGTVIEAPMVGTFYRSPSPGARPFVEVGAQVSAGQTLCIIEAMKLMNEIESEVSGTVVAILADNGQAVQFGQPIFKIRPS